MKFTDIENSLEQERRRLMTEVQRIEGALYALANIRYGADTVKHRGHPEQKTRRTMSAAARKRIGDAQRKRWAKVKRK